MNETGGGGNEIHDNSFRTKEKVGEDPRPKQKQQTTILEEVFTQDYNVTEEEVDEYCRVIGIDTDHEPQLVPLARAALVHPLPSSWTPVEDFHLGLYFYNKDSGESRWTHPVDNIVRSIVTRHRTNTSSESYSEEFGTEEDQLISEFLRAQVSEHEASHSDSDALGHYTDLGATHSNLGQDVPCKPVKVCQAQGSIRGRDEGCDTDESHAVPRNSLVLTDRKVKCTDSERNVKVNVTENLSGELCINDISNNQSLIHKDDSRDVRKEEKETECVERQEEESELGRNRPADIRPASAPAPSMFGEKDSLGRGLGCSPLSSRPLGTPSSLAAPAPLGKPVLGGTQLPSGRVPPIGGQLTPLAPIAAANRGCHLQLAPLKPLGPNPSSPGHQQDSKDGRGNPPLRRQPAHKDGEVWGGRRGRGDPEKQAGVSIGSNGGPVRGEGDGAVVPLGSPPKSILKGPVLVSGVAANKGFDRLSLMEPKETKNLRFDFTTDDIDFHTSEEEYDEEEIVEEEEEEYEFEDEEYDSEAEDLEEEEVLRATDYSDDESNYGGLVLNNASDLLPPRPTSSVTRPSAAIARPGSSRPSQHMPHGPDPWADEKMGSPMQPPRKDTSGDPLQTFKMEREKEQSVKSTENKEVKPKETPVNIETSKEQSKVKEDLPENSSKCVSGSQNNSTSTKAQVPTNTKNLSSETHNEGNVGNASSPGKALPSSRKSSSDVKQASHHPEERKLELESAPKTRKINPLDRIVAKLSGRTEGNNQGSGNPITDSNPSAVRGVVKTVMVNLTELMNNTDEDVEDEGSDNTVSGEEEVNESELRKECEAEEMRLRDQHESQLKNLRDSLRKEYKAKEEKIRSDHKNALVKYEEQEKQKFEQAKKQIESNFKQKSEKLIETTKAEMEKNFTEMKTEMVKDLEKGNQEEIEKLKMKFVQEMKETKERLHSEHDEELKDLEQELKALYSQQKLAKQGELNAQKVTAASRSSKERAAAVEELEQSLTELLHERQRDLKKGHNKQLAILSDELEMELEKAARQAKDKEMQEKRSHASRFAKLKEGHEEEIKQIEKSYQQELHDLATEHEKDILRLKAQFKAELTEQKTELENKLMEFRTEYEQKLSCLEYEREVEEQENSHTDDSSEPRQNSKAKDEVPPRSSSNHKEKAVTTEPVVENTRKQTDDENQRGDLLRELRERRKNLEEDLEELKAQENKVKELRVQRQAACTPHSPCSNMTCIHASKYQKLKDKYSSLVNRIKSEKAKRVSRKPSSSHNPIINTTLSLSSDKSSLSSVNVTENNDVTSNTSSPQKVRTSSFSTIDASEDEDLRLASQVLRKYSKNVDYGNSKHSLLLNKPLTSIPKKAWVEDELLAAGKRELKKTEEFLDSGILKLHHPTHDLDVEGIQKEILRQNASFQAPASKKSRRRLSLARGGSLSSDTESDDPLRDPTQDLLTTTPDFGLNSLLGELSLGKKSVFSKTKTPGPKRGMAQPLRPSASLERGLNNITQPYNDSITRYSTFSPSAVGGLKRFNSGSVPDLGPEAVDRIASVNQYLQQRWTSYFGELSIPLGGKVGWPSHAVGQPTLLSSKNTSDNVFMNNSINSGVPPKLSTAISNKISLKQPNLKEDININQKIDDLRAWLEKAQATSAAVAVEKLGQTGTLQ